MNEKIVPNSAEDLVGNTNTKSPKKQANKAKNWFFTFNNYTADDILEIVPVFKDKCEKYIFEKEIGECGTPHLQGYIQLKEKARPTELNLNKKIHWEVAKGTEQENIVYCSKDYRGDKTKEIYKSDNIKIPKPLKIIKDLRPWQVKIENFIKEEPDDRKIIWVYDIIGNNGKSALSRYLINKYDALYITEGKKNDIINIVYNKALDNTVDIVILDVPRANGNNISYKSIEEIKNGIICNCKYETGNILINPPHIIIFSNSMPELDKFSLDRWEVYEIKNNDLEKLEILGG